MKQFFKVNKKWKKKFVNKVIIYTVLYPHKKIEKDLLSAIVLYLHMIIQVVIYYPYIA